MKRVLVNGSLPKANGIRRGVITLSLILIHCLVCSWGGAATHFPIIRTECTVLVWSQVIFPVSGPIQLIHRANANSVPLVVAQFNFVHLGYTLGTSYPNNCDNLTVVMLLQYLHLPARSLLHFPSLLPPCTNVFLSACLSLFYHRIMED